MQCIGTTMELHRIMRKNTTWDERRDEGSRTSKVSDLPWLSESQTTSDAIAGNRPVPSLAQITPSPKLDVSTFLFVHTLYFGEQQKPEIGTTSPTAKWHWLRS